MSSPTASAPPDSRAPGGNYRWVICSLLFFSVAVNYIDRLVIGILKKPLSAELGWSDADYGHIAAAFSFAYAFGYLIGGPLMDRWGVKKGLPIFVTAWSIAASAHGLVGLIGVEEVFRFSYPAWIDGGLRMATLVMPMTAAGFMFARIALGLTEGGNFPGAIKAVAEWYPVRERALATGLFNAGTNVGAVVCPIAVPVMYRTMGWESTFYVTGATGFIWVVAWWLIYDRPEKHRRVSAAELAYINEGVPPEPEKESQGSAFSLRAIGAFFVAWFRVLGYRAVWAYVLASILAGPAWGFYQFFLPDFLDKTFHLDLQQIGNWTGAFFLIAAVGGVLGGWLANKLMNRGWSVNGARKISLLICAIAVVPVFLAPFAPNVWLAVLIVGIAGSAHQGWSANLFSVVSDTMPKSAVSTVVGLGGFVAYFTGGFVNEFTGQILQKTGSYVYVFAYFSGMYLLSLLLIQFLVPVIGRTAAARVAPKESAPGR